MKSHRQKACHRVIRKAKNEILNVSINNSSSPSSSAGKCNKKENTHSHANKKFNKIN